MKKFISFLGMLAIAAILMAGFTACSSEDMVDNPVQPTQSQKIHVTVGAGLGGDDAQTRSQVVLSSNSQTGKTIRTLTFTEGDRLYIQGDFSIEDVMLERHDYRMAGYLDLISGAGTTSAMFSGDLTVWKIVWETYEIVNDFATTHPGNPLELFGSNTFTATLIHKDAKAGIVSIDPHTHLCSFDYTYSFVTGESDNVKKLMETALYVRGNYDPSKRIFNLACGDPIFNCNFTIDGLDYNHEYYVRIVKDGNITSYIPKDFNASFVTTDWFGYVKFACTTPLSGSGDWKIQLCSYHDFTSGPVYERPFTNNPNIGAKVYNVGNAPTTDPDTHGPNTNPGNNPDPATDVISLSVVTSAFVGNIIGTDGKVYPYNAPFPDGVGKAAMICYVPSTGNGLAIELNIDPKECSFGNGTMPSGIDGGSWRTPSRDDWRNMVNNCGGSVSAFLEKYNATGVPFKSSYLGDFLGMPRVRSTAFWTSDGYHKYESDAYGPEGPYGYYFNISSGSLSFPDEYLVLNDGGIFHLACFEF